MSDLASNLEGKKINAWKVERKLSNRGGFSSAYVVTHDDGTPAFMKAINIGYAASSIQFRGNRADLMSHLFDEFKYERDLLKLCGEVDLDRIVVALDSGEYSEVGTPYFVPYLVFEFCKDGDVRRHPKLKDAGLVWRLKVFHGVCIGIRQLHSRNISHEDLKPANVLIFKDDFSKIADLGRSLRHDNSPRSAQNEPRCDLDFAPIELLYNHCEADWNTRHKGADFYMLGGLLAFFVANTHIFSLILSKLPSTYDPKNWKGGYAAALPAVQSAVYDAVAEITAPLPDQIRCDVKEMLLWLCHPEPTKRGHPQTVIAKSGDRYSLERIISIADRIANQARCIA